MPFVVVVVLSVKLSAQSSRAAEHPRCSLQPAPGRGLAGLRQPPDGCPTAAGPEPGCGTGGEPQINVGAGGEGEGSENPEPRSRDREWAMGR